MPSVMVTALGKAGKIGAQKTIFPALPSAMTMTLGKEFFLKKIQTLPSVGQRALGKEFFYKKIKNLCRVPAGLALGKATVNGTDAMTVAFLCRVPDKRHSAKRALPINFLSCVLYRVLHSAKALPSAK